MTGSCYDHRQGWIEDQLEELAGSFAVDVCGFSVMANHVHVVLRTKLDVADIRRDEEEVVRRWWRLLPNAATRKAGLRNRSRRNCGC